MQKTIKKQRVSFLKKMEDRVMRKAVILLVVLVAASNALAVTTYNTAWRGPAYVGTNTQDWFTASNWQYGVPTIQADYATSGKFGVTTYHGTGSTNYDTDLLSCPVIANGDARAVEIRIGGQAVTVANYTTAYLQMDSGTLKTMNWLSMGCNTGAGDRAGIFYMHGGTVTLGGATADGLDNGSRTTGHLYVGNGSTSGGWGKMYMDGGIIDCGASFTIGAGLTDGEAYLSDDAIIYANTFSMRPNASNTNNPYLDVSGLAKIIINGDATGNLNTWVGAGWITAEGGDATVPYQYFTTGQYAGKTVIGVIPEPATIGLLGLGALGLIRRKK
jgi:hypothetical protein